MKPPLEESITEAIVIGASRTPIQDIEYPIRQLVEIALRALSPGVNDPFTAIAVIDRLAGSIATIMTRGEPQSVWQDENDVVRMLLPTASFDGILDAAFNQIRQAGAGQPAILICLVDRLDQLLGQANERQAKPIMRHIERTRATVEESVRDDSDRTACLTRADEAARMQSKADRDESSG